MKKSVLSLLLGSMVALSSVSATANEWVTGNVAMLEDYRPLDANLGILITLANKVYYNGGSSALPANCQQRYRVVVGQENMSADVLKSIFAMMLTARASGDKVRLFVNPSNSYSGGYCAVQLGTIGDGSV